MKMRLTRMHDGTSAPKPTPEAVSAPTSYNNISYSAKNVNSELKNSAEPPPPAPKDAFSASASPEPPPSKKNKKNI